MQGRGSNDGGKLSVYIDKEYTGVKSIEFLKGMEFPEEGLFREVEDFCQCGGCFAGALPQGLHRLAVAALRAVARDGRWKAWRARNGRPPPSPPAGGGAYFYLLTTLRERFV